jgi:uncharacterized membrane protein SpoIIM required for sporulation
MINEIKRVYRQAYYDNKKEFLIGWELFILITILTAIICSVLHINIVHMFKEMDNKFPSYHSQFPAFMGIFLNNIKTCLQILVISFIPILFLPWISIIFNSAVIGFMVYAVIYVHQNVFKMFILGVFPHGIIEYSAFILSACITIKFQRLWIKKIKNVFKHKTNKKPLGSLFTIFLQIFEQFILIILPLILIASFIETYISKFLLDKFM